MNLFSYICSRNKVMMENVKPLILISNDDGYHAKGLLSLIDMLQPMARLLVCAPDSARSGYACAFSATTPLRLKLRRQWCQHLRQRGGQCLECQARWCRRN